jgi:zinc transport system permease protein
MIGDTLSHASLAGITAGLLFGQNPVLGAFVFTSVCGALIEWLRNWFKKYTDLILTIVLALSVGTAISIISSGKLHANADSFMFGSILTVTTSDMVMICILSILTVVTLAVFYHPLLYIAYDEEAAKMAGVKVKLLNYVFSIMTAAAVSVSIHIVGVLVLSSMIALPVATAIQLKQGFFRTLIWSVGFSIIDITLGLFLSFYLNVAPGGFTALVSVVILVFIMLLQKVKQLLGKRKFHSEKQ